MVTAKEIDLGPVEYFKLPSDEVAELKLNRLIRAAQIDIFISQSFSEIDAAEGQIPVQEGWRKAALKARTVARKTIFSSYLDILDQNQESINIAKTVLNDLERYAATGMFPEYLMAEEGLRDKLKSYLSELQSYDYENRYIRPSRGNSPI